MPYLIDGHNLIPKIGLRLESPDDEAQLLRLLQEFSRLARRDAEVYFDGAPPGGIRTQRFGRVTAHFVRVGSTADNAIMGRLGNLGRAARNWTVVSSDHEVRVAAKAAKAGSMSSEEFARRVRELESEARGRVSPSSPSGQEGLSSEEVEQWLEFFDKRE